MAETRSTVAAGLPQKRARAVGIEFGCFPKLKVEMWKGDRLVKIEEFDDPREQFVRLFNEQQERIESMVAEATKQATNGECQTVAFTKTLEF